MIKKIINSLNDLGLDLLPEEIADILWLVDKMSPDSQPTTTALSNSGVKDEALSLEEPNPPPIKPFHPNQTNLDNLKTGKIENRSTNKTVTSISPIQIPIHDTLLNSLTISEALRPLKHRVRSKRNFIIDEEKTVNQIAEQDLWTIITKPKPSYRFDVSYVVDSSDSMILWEKLVKEFELILKGLGAFRKLEKWTILTNIKTPKLYKKTPSNLESPELHNYKELSGLSDTPKIIFVVTDCISISWYNGEVAKILTEWGKNNIVVIVQVLPETLWVRTALGKMITETIFAPVSQATNSQLKTKTLSPSGNKNNAYSFPIPTINIETKVISSWVKVIQAVANNEILGTILWKENILKSYPTNDSRSSIEYANKTLDSFWATASPVAQQLAVLMSAVPFNLELIHLIQKHVLKERDQSYLAEVFLSGLIKKIKYVDNLNKEHFSYDFIPEARKLLLDSLNIYDFQAISKQLSKYIEKNFGQGSNFLAYIEDPNSVNKIEINEDTKPLIGITIEVLKRLGIKYNDLANKLEKQIQISEKLSDTQTDKIVLDTANNIATIISTDYSKVFPSFNPRQYFSVQIGENIFLPITNFAWSPNGSWLIIICGNSLCNLLDLSSRQVIWTTTLKENITAICWSSNNDLIVLGTNEGTIYLLEAKTGAIQCTLLGHTNTIYSLQWMTRDKINYHLFSCSADKTIRQWSVETYETKQIGKWRTSDLEAIAWTPNWDTFATISTDKKVNVWHRNIDTWYVYKGYKRSTSVSWSLDNKYIIIGLLNADIAFIPFPKYKSEDEIVFFKGHNKQITNIALSADNKILASKSLDNTIRVWTTNNQEQLLEIETQTIGQPLSTSLLFHPYFPILAFLSDADTTLHIVELDTQEINNPINRLFARNIDLEKKVEESLANLGKERLVDTVVTNLKKETSIFALWRAADILVQIAIKDLEKAHYYSAIKLLDYSLITYKKLNKLVEINKQNDLQNSLAITRMNKGNALQQIGKLPQALIYQKNATKILKLLANNSFTAFARNLIAALSNQGNTFSALGRFAEAVSCFNEARIIFDSLLSKNKTEALIKDAVLLFNNTGETLRAIGQYSDAVTHYDEAISLISEKESNLISNLPALLMNKGIALTVLKQFPESITNLDASITLYKNLMEKEKNYQLESGIALAFINKGIALGDFGKLIEAISCYDEAILNLENLIEVKGHTELENDLASALNNKGTVLNKINKSGEAINLYDEAIKIRRKLVEKENRQDLVNDLASVLNNKGYALNKLNSFEQAIICYTEAISLYSKLVNTQGRKDLENTLAEAFANKGDVFYSLGQLQEFIVNYDKAIDIRNRLVAKQQIHVKELARLLTNKGVALTKLSLFTEAFICHDQATNYLNFSLEEGDTELKEIFVKSLIPKGESLIHLERFSEAIECYDQSINILDELLLRNFKITSLFLEKLKAEGVPDDILNNLQNLQNQPTTGQENLLSKLTERFGDKKSTELQSLILKYDDKTKKVDLIHYLAIALRNRGTAQRELKQFSAAIESYDRAISICKHIEYDSYEVAKTLAEILSNKGNALFQQNLPREALKCFDESIALCRKLLEKNDYEEIINLTMSLVNKGIALLLHFQNSDEAKPYFEEAIVWREKAVKAGRDDFLPQLILAIRYQIITLAILDNFKEIDSILNRIKEHFTPNTKPNIASSYLLRELNELKKVVQTLPGQHFYKEFYVFLDKQIALYN